MTTALKALLSLSFGMPLAAAAVAILWGIQMQEESATDGVQRERVELIAVNEPDAPPK